MRRIGLLSLAAAVTVCALAAKGVAQNLSFVVLDDEESVDWIIPELVSGNGVADVDTDDFYPDDKDAAASLRIDATGGDFQRFNTNISDWSFDVVEDPTTDEEFRYITFAWKKEGGTGMQLQLHGQPGTWGHRYHAGANMQGWNPSIQVTDEFPEDWQVFTRDLFDDWGEFNLTGFAFSPSSLDAGWYDHIALHQGPDDPFEPLAVEAEGKLTTTWAGLKVR